MPLETNTVLGTQKEWWKSYPYPSFSIPNDCNGLETLLDGILVKKILMSDVTRRLALESEDNIELPEAWSTLFCESETHDMLLGMTSLGSPSFDARLNTKQTSENDSQIVTDTLIREAIVRLGMFRKLGHFSRNVTQQTAVVSKKALPSRSGQSRPDGQLIFEHDMDRLLDNPQLLLIEEKEGGISVGWMRLAKISKIRFG